MEIRLSKTAHRALLRSNKREIIRKKIGELTDDLAGQSANIKKLQGRPGFRLRVQDWRILFRIEEDILWIDDIAPRGSAYEDKI